MCLAQIAAICLPSPTEAIGYGRVLVGKLSETEVRHHGYYYPSCKGKCEPILQHMLQGLEVDGNPLSPQAHRKEELEIVLRTNGWW